MAHFGYQKHEGKNGVQEIIKLMKRGLLLHLEEKAAFLAGTRFQFRTRHCTENPQYEHVKSQNRGCAWDI
jgi:hypothetical protein